MDHGGVVAGQDLVSDGDGGDFGGREIALDVRFDPGGGLRRIAHLREAFVAEADDELDARVREGAEDAGIGVVQLDLPDADGLEDRDDFFRRGEVVGDLTVVDSDRKGRCQQEWRICQKYTYTIRLKLLQTKSKRENERCEKRRT